MELLGSLAKRDASVMSLVLADTEIMKGLEALSSNHNGGGNVRLISAIGRIITLLRRE